MLSSEYIKKYFCNKYILKNKYQICLNFSIITLKQVIFRVTAGLSYSYLCISRSYCQISFDFVLYNINEKVIFSVV